MSEYLPSPEPLSHFERTLEAYLRHPKLYNAAAATIMTVGVVGGGILVKERYFDTDNSVGVSLVDTFKARYTDCLDGTPYAPGNARIHEFKDGNIRGVDVTPAGNIGDTVSYVYTTGPSGASFIPQAAEPASLLPISALESACHDVAPIR